jgi:ssDNA-binding Zn-finger/Zn-ribbon topoisomerase 1
MPGTDVVVQGEIVREVQSFTLPDAKTLKDKLQAIQHFQSLVQSSLIKDMDYGIIPGVKKPSLYQPGAEKIAKLLDLAEYYDMMTEIEDWEKGFFYYKIRCTLKLIGTDIVISQGLGSSNSKEPKFKYRWLWPGDVPPNMDKSKLVTRKTKKGGLQYRFDNEEIFEIVNTILKMGKKRAFIDAVKSAGRLSNLFTQDVEDIESLAVEDDEVEESDNGKETPKSDLGVCPECKSPMVMRQGKYGEFLACSGYPKCQYKPPKEKKGKDNDTPDAEKGQKTAGKGDSVEKLTQADGSEDWSKQQVFIDAKDAYVLRLEWSKDTFVKNIKEAGLLNPTGLITIAKRGEVIAFLKTECEKLGV